MAAVSDKTGGYDHRDASQLQQLRCEALHERAHKAFQAGDLFVVESVARN